VARAALYGLLAASPLLIGAVLALKLRIPEPVIGAVSGVGAGTLVGAVAFELTLPSLLESRSRALALGLAAGALVYYALDRFVERRLADNEGESARIVVGAFLDGIPESVAIGITAVESGALSVAFVVAVIVSNFPEALASTPDFMRAGRRPRNVMLMWLAIVVASGVAAAAGYAFLRNASGDVVAVVQTFAAGAVLTMVATAMIPDAYEKATPPLSAGLWFVLGFATATLLAVAE
jgi:ZIP family zinc transporter